MKPSSNAQKGRPMKASFLPQARLAFWICCANAIFILSSYCVRTTFGDKQSSEHYCSNSNQIIPVQGLDGIWSAPVQYLYRIRIRYEAGTNRVYTFVTTVRYSSIPSWLIT